MDPHRVIVVLVLIDGWRKLDIYVFGNSSWDHSLLLVSDLEVIGLWGQNMQPLWRWRVIYQSKFHRVRLVCLEACKFDNAWWCAKYAVWAHSIVHVLLSDAHSLVCLGLGNDSALDLDLVLTVGWRLVSKTGFKWLVRVKSVATDVIRWRDIPFTDGVRLKTALDGAINWTISCDLLKRRRVNILSWSQIWAD